MSSERLSAQDWVNAGLSALSRTGFTALKADALAKVLRVSRGSFYWHFADIEAFHAAVLRRWREVAMDEIIAEVDGAAGDRLRMLLQRVFGAENRLEIAVRSWAMADKQVKAAVEAVDHARLRYVEGLLTDAGLSGQQARTRAQVLYWSYLGYALSGEKLNARRLATVLAELLALAESRRAE